MPKLLRQVSLPVPFIFIPLLGWMYEPINRAWTVEHFGCGCPRLDGSTPYNANYFNLVLWLLVLIITLFIWLGLFRPEARGLKSRTYLLVNGVGIAMLAYLAFQQYMRGFWL